MLFRSSARAFPSSSQTVCPTVTLAPSAVRQRTLEPVSSLRKHASYQACPHRTASCRTTTSARALAKSGVSMAVTSPRPTSSPKAAVTLRSISSERSIGSTGNPAAGGRCGASRHGACNTTALRSYLSGENAAGITILFSCAKRVYPRPPFFSATSEGGQTPSARILLRISQRWSRVL